MGLPNLLKANRIPIMRLFKERLPRKSASEIVQKDLPPEQRYAPYPPFDSAWEVFTWEFLQKQDAAWRPQQTFGRPGSKGSTRVDFINDNLRIVLFLDGAHWHEGERKTGADILKRAQVTGYGYRVVVWLIFDFDYLWRNINLLYRKMIFGT